MHACPSPLINVLRNRIVAGIRLICMCLYLKEEDVNSGTRGLTGAVLVLSSEQAFSHSLLIGFPHQAFAQSILLPFAAVSIVTGIAFLLVSLFRDQKS